MSDYPSSHETQTMGAICGLLFFGAVMFWTYCTADGQRQKADLEHVEWSGQLTPSGKEIGYKGDGKVVLRDAAVESK